MIAETTRYLVWATVVENRFTGEDANVLVIESQEIARNAIPGSFVTIKVGNGDEPLLRRPFSIHRVMENRFFWLLVRKIGKGTRRIALTQPGEQISVLGPLGCGYQPSKDIRRVVLVGGGVGVAPLLFAADRLLQDKVETVVALGAARSGNLYSMDAFRLLEAPVHLATEDGSTGRKGLVTDLLAETIPTDPIEILMMRKKRGFDADLLAEKIPPAEFTEIFACGPMPMLGAVARWARAHGVKCKVCLETVMACGVGSCQGCAIPIRSISDAVSHYERICCEGPVFDSWAVFPQEEAHG